MGRPRAFDEAQVIEAAATLFAGRAYDSVSVDDLVGTLGVHRNSLYKIFGSKRGLYRAALRWHVRERVRPLLTRITQPDHDGSALDFLILATAERAPADAEVADLMAAVFTEFDAALGPDGTAALMGKRLRERGTQWQR